MNIRLSNFSIGYNNFSKGKQEVSSFKENASDKLQPKNINTDNFLKAEDSDQSIKNIMESFERGNLTVEECKEKLTRFGATNIEEEGTCDMEGNSSTTIKFKYNNKEYSTTLVTKNETKDATKKRINSDEEWDNWSDFRRYHFKSEMPKFNFIKTIEE